MSKLLPIILVLVLVGVGAFFVLNDNGDDDSEENGTEQSGETSELNDELDFGDTFGFDDKFICEYSNEDGESVVAYFDNGRFRADTLSSDGVEGVILIKDNTSYVWNSDSAEGFSFDLNESDPDSTEEVQTVQDFEADAEAADADCFEEDFDDNIFDLPDDVNFENFEQLINDELDALLQESFQDLEGSL